jgi:hypothetical protein
MMDLIAYGTILHFCYLNRLNWLVAGHVDG